MDKRQFSIISVIIAIAIIVTVVIQGLWTLRSFGEYKRQFSSEVQQSLDNAVEGYYTDLAKVNVIQMHNIKEGEDIDLLVDSLHHGQRHQATIAFKGGDSAKFQKEISSIKVLKLQDSNHDTLISITNENISQGEWHDELGRDFAKLANKIIISLESDSLNLLKLQDKIDEELIRQDLNLTYSLRMSSLGNEEEILDETVPSKVTLVRANPAYLPPGIALDLEFSTDFMEIFRRGIVEFMLTLTIALLMIGTLIYLYRVIRLQKNLAEIKRDLIGNITHEFKTPIATVSSAIEAIEHFNEEADPKKTKKYLDISSTQLKRLDGMVEKLMETAAIEEDKIELNRSNENISSLLRRLIDRYQVMNDKKSIKSEIQENVQASIDPFHFENAISNIIDNAVKYGGDTITVNLEQESGRLKINISDNGPGIAKGNASKIFDKFYRVPSGNRHDVKGYGIGLYYTRKIIEKHGGTIKLEAPNTTFAIEI